MCKSPLHEFLQALPKCEHHVHVEGTLTPAMLFSLAARNGIKLPTDDAAFASPAALHRRYDQFSSLDDFLHYFYIGSSVLLHASDFELMAYSYLETLSAQGVRHVELSFDPQIHAARGVPYRAVVGGLDAARTRAARDFPDMSVALIPCLVRHLPADAARATACEILDAGHFADGTVAGLGMSGTEAGKHPSGFAAAYSSLRDAGVRNLTAHYGEEGPAEYVSAAVAHLRVVRVDHGRRAGEDPALLSRLAADGTLLTLCPVSNAVLGGVAAVRELPVREFLEAGVCFSINSDDPAYFGANVLNNYCAVQDAFRLSMAEWEVIAQRSVQGSWCSEKRKRELLTVLKDVVADHKRQHKPARLDLQEEEKYRV